MFLKFILSVSRCKGTAISAFPQSRHWGILYTKSLVYCTKGACKIKIRKTNSPLDAMILTYEFCLLRLDSELFRMFVADSHLCRIDFRRNPAKELFGNKNRRTFAPAIRQDKF